MLASKIEEGIDSLSLFPEVFVGNDKNFGKNERLSSASSVSRLATGTTAAAAAVEKRPAFVLSLFARLCFLEV